jgi:hypothetical protein
VSAQARYLVSLLAGVACLLAGISLTRVNWRDDIAPFSLRTRTLDVTLHPERYSARALGLIRALNCAGAILVSLAAVQVLFAIAQVMHSGD